VNKSFFRLAVSFAAVSLVLVWAAPLAGQETLPVGKSKIDQERNAELLSGYDYKKYPEALTGYTGQDRQRIAFWQWQDALRTRVGPRGNYKTGLTELPNGKLVLAACRDNYEQDRSKRQFSIFIYESVDQGSTWRDVGNSPLFGKEPSLTALADGTLVLTAQKGYFGPGAKLDEIPISRSTDGGRTWETTMMPGEDYPRNLIVEPDGSLLLVRALKSDWKNQGKGSPNLQLCRSKDGGRTWQYSEGIVDWNYPGFGEVSAIRLRNGKYLAALRRQIPDTQGEGFEDTVLTESLDGGKRWSKPWRMSQTAEVHVYLSELRDGRILATYSNYHLPWGVYGVASKDQGKTWDLNSPIQLALSADLYVGWPVTLQLRDNSLVTSYAITAFLKQPPETTVSEVVRWRLP
jgi:hypothetical protein